MSRYRYCEVGCDLTVARDCWENGPTASTMAEAVKDARASGWYVGPANAEKDACPECRKAAAQ